MYAPSLCFFSLLPKAYMNGLLEFHGNSRTQTNQTKLKFIRLYYLGCWIQIIQCDEQSKSSTKFIVLQISNTVWWTFVLIVLFDLFGLANFHKTQLPQSYPIYHWDLEICEKKLEQLMCSMHKIKAQRASWNMNGLYWQLEINNHRH